MKIIQIEKYLSEHEVVVGNDRNDYYAFTEKLIPMKVESLFESQKDELIIDTCIEFDSLSARTGKIYLSDFLTNKDEKITENIFYNFYFFCVAGLALNYYEEVIRKESYVYGLAHQGEVLLMSFACNQFDLIEHCYPKIKESLLNGKMSKSLAWGGDGEGNVVPPTPQRLGVLAIEMMASEHKQTIDWHSVNIPTDPFYIRFCQEALYEKDESIVKEWLMELCDNHLKWVSLFLDNNQSSITGHEIEQPVLLLWPFEYQAVKNFRARHGLTTPEIDHPLLKTPMAIDHRPDFSQWHKPEWFQPVMDKLKEANPALAFLPDLFK
ncbi:TPA: hypothetical protein ACSTL1_002005 [Serratia fonticola]|uniref:hypothetical protein n=1 Tax=Serratia fonticola TaxID=47917 RepID=UPI00217C7080|nr:hypothetical protein [Serratia fonticola]CAI1534828.1 Uncharacterised protein [Serratia fonticola]CAI1803685.1 Uncharacterised protein [Serratia fonticola]CAI1836549.1 Uncharacterised protein [Serratia fonticola]